MHITLRLTSLFALGLLGSCINAEAPHNPFADPETNGISGTVVVDGVDDPGNVVITVYDANNPGPPAGTGRPVTLSGVPFTDFTGDTSGGLQSADYYVGNLPDGDYLVNALLDQDGDFNPFANILAGATCGDHVGTHLVDIPSQQSATVSVSGGELVDDVTIAIAAEITTERPVFTLPEEQVTFIETSQQETYTVTATNLHSKFPQVWGEDELPDGYPYPDGYPVDLYGPCDPDPSDPRLCDVSTLEPCDTAFWLWAVDDDGDGVIDPHPDPSLAALGIKNVWPRVFIQYLGVPQEDGTFAYPDNLIEGATYAGVNPVFATEAAIPALWPSDWPIGTPFPMRELELTWSPAVQVVLPDGTDGPFIDAREFDTDVSEFPSGAWGLTMISFTGQTWILPNEGAVLGDNSPEGETYNPAEQGRFIITQDSAK